MPGIAVESTATEIPVRIDQSQKHHEKDRTRANDGVFLVPAVPYVVNKKIRRHSIRRGLVFLTVLL